MRCLRFRFKKTGNYPDPSFVVVRAR